jgi:hypothetical protein
MNITLEREQFEVGSRMVRINLYDVGGEHPYGYQLIADGETVYEANLGWATADDARAPAIDALLMGGDQ